jgi:hypothetical protein
LIFGYLFIKKKVRAIGGGEPKKSKSGSELQKRSFAALWMTKKEPLQER